MTDSAAAVLPDEPELAHHDRQQQQQQQQQRRQGRAYRQDERQQQEHDNLVNCCCCPMTSPLLPVVRCIQRCSSPSWMTPAIYNTFRYGLVLLYLGTLMLVIGYHNEWVGFMRYVGLGLVSLGLISIGSAGWQTCSRFMASNELHTRLRRHQQIRSVPGAGPRGGSSNSKQELPSYDAVESNDLPTYDEAEALRLDPRFLSDHWVKRHSIPSNLRLHSTSSILPPPVPSPISQEPQSFQYHYRYQPPVSQSFLRVSSDDRAIRDGDFSVLTPTDQSSSYPTTLAQGPPMYSVSSPGIAVPSASASTMEYACSLQPQALTSTSISSSASESPSASTTELTSNQQQPPMTIQNDNSSLREQPGRSQRRQTHLNGSFNQVNPMSPSMAQQLVNTTTTIRNNNSGRLNSGHSNVVAVAATTAANYMVSAATRVRTGRRRRSSITSSTSRPTTSSVQQSFEDVPEVYLIASSSDEMRSSFYATTSAASTAASRPQTAIMRSYSSSSFESAESSSSCSWDEDVDECPDRDQAARVSSDVVADVTHSTINALVPPRPEDPTTLNLNVPSERGGENSQDLADENR